MINLSRVDLNLLVVLEAIVAEGGVSRAAERLNLTQPAVSHALARLRELFDDPLFVRAGRNLAPTALTKGLVEPLRQSLQALGALIEKGEGFDPARARTVFTVSMRDPMEVLILPKLMKRLAREAPGIDLRTVQMRRRSVENGLADGTLDAAFDVALPLSERIHRQRISADRFVVAARKGHPRVRPGFTLATYLAEKHVMVTSRRRGPGAEDIELGQHGQRRHVSLRCRNYLAAIQVVAGSDLVLTMTARYASLLGAASGVRVLAMPLRMPTLDLFLYWHDRVHNDPANRWLRLQLVEALGKTARP
ncbi:LysR family transcriptional regulator [Reyranella soli]|nr:LysR family transcriptional regulator [Reyranella soli]